MYCVKCGKEISDESKFCTYCGNNCTSIKNQKEKINATVLDDVERVQSETLHDSITSTNDTNIYKVIGRWIAVPIVWLISLFGIGFLVNIFSDDILFIQYIISPAISSAIAIYFGVRVSPTHKKIVSIVLFTLSILLAGIFATLYIVDPSFTGGISIVWHYLSLAATIGGSGYVMYQFFEQGEDYNLFD